MKIAFLGFQEYFGTFQLLGADLFDVRDPKATESLIATLDLSQYAAIFLLEDLVKTPFLEDFVKYREEVVMISTSPSRTGRSSRLLDELVAKETGIKR
ncbi:MAG: hypothetical protein WDA18_03305 [Candidatus Ratteibacteria bacterium]|jgi:vacuolar-type H+-ATPase subunit F/Vma7